MVWMLGGQILIQLILQKKRKKKRLIKLFNHYFLAEDGCGFVLWLVMSLTGFRLNTKYEHYFCLTCQL